MKEYKMVPCKNCKVPYHNDTFTCPNCGQVSYDPVVPMEKK